MRDQINDDVGVPFFFPGKKMLVFSFFKRRCWYFLSNVEVVSNVNYNLSTK
jgi:hypothetical protein